MTSKISFLKLVRETLRRHLTLVFITILMFFVHIISFFLNVQNSLNSYTYATEDLKSITSAVHPKQAQIAQELANLCAPSFTSYIIAILCGVFFAFAFFQYLHSKKQTDFYDSLPIKRQSRFILFLVCSLGLFLICTVVTLGVELAIIYSIGYGNTLFCQLMFCNFICMLGTFLAFWSTTALAMILTGNTIVGFLGFGAMLCYVPLAIGYLVPTYAATFFNTYVFRALSEKYYYFSPATASYSAMQHFDEWSFKSNGPFLISCYILAAAIILLSYILFLRRPSEAAGRAMAFEKVNPVIRYALTVPLTLYAGLLMYTISDYASTAWLIFGILFGGFLVHGIIECIFDFDIKAITNKKLQLLYTLVFCLAFAFLFWSDLFHYDEYLPKTEDVKSVNIYTYYFNTENEMFPELQDELSGEMVDDALLVLKDIMNSSKSYSSELDYKHMNNFHVTYKLKNGMTKERQYCFYGDELPESLDKLYATDEFKDDYCVLYHYDKLDISTVGVNNGPEYFELDLTVAEQKELFDLYLSEFTPMTLTRTFAEQIPLELTVEIMREENYFPTYRYYIYESFEKTLQFLKDRGVKTFSESENIKLQNLEIYEGKYDKEERFISETDTLQTLKPFMILDSFPLYDNEDEYVTCNLRYEIDGKTEHTNVFLKRSALEALKTP